MKKLLLVLGALLFATPAFAQATYPTPAGPRVQGVVPLACDGSGANCVPSSASGAVAQGSTTSGQQGGLIQGAVTTAAPTYTTGTTNPISLGTDGSQRVNVTASVLPTGAATQTTLASILTSVSATGASSLSVQGAGAAASATIGNPVGIGGVYNLTLPTLTTGQRGDAQLNSRGGWIVDLRDNSGNPMTFTAQTTDALTAGMGMFVAPLNRVFNGTTWDRSYSIPALSTTGIGVQAAGMVGQYNATLSTLADTNYGRLQIDINGNLRTRLTGTIQTGADARINASGLAFVSDPAAAANASLLAQAPFNFNGTSWDRNYGITGLTTAGTGVQAVGNAAPGNTTAPTAVTAGQYVRQWYGLNGQTAAMIAGSSGTVANVGSPADALAVNPSLFTFSQGSLFNNSTYDRARSITGADGTGLGVQAVAQAPVSAAAGAIAPVVLASVGSALTVKASAGNLYEWTATNGATAGFIMLFNSASPPADGVVSPQQCVALPANATVTWSADSGVPERFSTAASMVFSTTGCFTKTTTPAIFMRARVQ